MTTQRVMRMVRPLVALVALALMLIVLGLALTGPARAEGAQPERVAAVVAANGQVNNAVVRFGDDVFVPAGERVESVGAFGGDVTIDGTVSGEVVAFGGDVFVTGTVEREIAAFGGDVSLSRTADVGGRLSPRETSIVLFGGTLTRAPGSEITGDVQRVADANWAAVANWVTQHTVIRPWWGFTLMGWIVQTAFYLVLALVAAALMPNQLRAVQRHVRLKPAGSLGWGALIFLVAGPAVLVVLVISIVGLLLVLPYLLFVLLAYFFATTAVAAFVAQRVLAGSGRNENLMLATALGVVGTTIVSRIPVLGPLVVVAMIVFGTGAAALAIVEWRQARASAAASATATAAPPASTLGAPAAETRALAGQPAPEPPAANATATTGTPVAAGTAATGPPANSDTATAEPSAET